MPNDFGISYDKAGFCAHCHDQIADLNGFYTNGTPRITQWHGKKDLMTVKLDDGSSLDISICRACKDAIKPEDMQELMESIIRGWHWEILNVVKWEQAKKDAYIKEYRQRYIINRNDKPWPKEAVADLPKPRADMMDVRV